MWLPVRFKYTQKCINRIIQNISIVDVIGDLYLKPIPTKNKNRFYLKDTPFDLYRKTTNNRVMYISTDKRMFKCFNTGKAGNVINFVQMFMNMNRKDAITFLLIKYDKENKYKEIIETSIKFNDSRDDLPF